MDRCLEPFKRSARQRMLLKTDTTLDHDCGTERNCDSMYTVQCCVFVDNMCDFQNSSSHNDCTFDARLVSKTRKDQQANVADFLSGWPSFTDSSWERQDSANWFLSNHFNAFVSIILAYQDCRWSSAKRSCQVLRDVRTIALQIRHRADSLVVGSFQ